MLNKKMLAQLVVMIVLVVGMTVNTYAFKEYPIGEEKIINYMKIAAV